ncbi:unnamed protein product, partial [marine sediment metagenome]
EMIKKVIEVLEKSSCNEIELVAADGARVRVVKNPPVMLGGGK